MTAAENIRLHILEKITNGFSEDSRIGRCGYEDVYMGEYKGKEIAVKLLRVDTVQGLDDQQFINEVGNLSMAEHPNIVKLLGYCYETQSRYVEHNGKKDLSKRIYRILCFEYLQGGSLDKHLYEKSLSPNWSARYIIIKGISEGLNFLHGREPPILHLDLKPANILLDSSMVPKVADFGLSRLFSESHTHATQRIIGTRNYMPPEFTTKGMISIKNDVFSLGVVMIEIMNGSLGSSNSTDMDDDAQLMQQVLTKWSTMIEARSKYPSEELHQVKTCMELAIRCVDSERDNRPTVADILDTLNKIDIKGKLVDVLPCPTAGPSNTVAKRMKTIPAKKKKRLKTIPAKKKKRLKTMIAEDIITNKHHHLNCMPRDNFDINGQRVPDRDTSSVVETLIIGRTEEKQKILSILSESITEEMVVLPIYGIGGIGKTTLAQLVFNGTEFHEYSKVWVYVSETLDLKKIGNSIISHLTYETSNIADKQMLYTRLGKLPAGNNILIVLDDIWEKEQDELDKLKAMLKLLPGRKVIIVTTRDKAIARKICSAAVPYKLEILTDDMCWTIIEHKSDFKNRPDQDQVKQIGKDIAIKCGGVALAAKTLGYMLREMTSDQWQSVRDDSHIWNLSTFEDPSLRSHQVLASLHLSYSYMPERLKLCFSYCAVFPKGRNLVKYDLIHQWIALGFPEPSRIFDSIQLCETYITQLLGMSFLEYSKTPSSTNDFFSTKGNTGWQDKGITMFTMHDLVHDLARAILADQVNDKGSALGNRCQYALLTDCSKPLQLSVPSPKNIKVLRFLDCDKLELCCDAFSLATRLHVLDLSECFIHKLPDSIGRLKQLRYLHAPEIRDEMIPNCITELTELNYLNLRGSLFISALPESIGDMKGLMHLDLSGCKGILELPVSFTDLKQLVYLDLSNCLMSISEALVGFTKLQYLNLSSELYTEKINIRRLSKDIRNLAKLRYLNLSGCMQAMGSTSEDQIYSLLDSIGTLANLEHLYLSENELIHCIPESIGNLRKLHTLDLSGCSDLKKLPSSISKMVSLKVLNVEDCDELDESIVSQSNVAVLPHFVVQASRDKYSSNIILLEPTNPDVLEIYKLENVKSVEEAQIIQLVQKQKISELKFQWTVDAERFVDDKNVLEKLVPPSSVEKLTIAGYESLNLPSWQMGIRQYLPNLVELNMWNFPKCNKLPPVGQLPNLERLSLRCMDRLEEWNTTYTSGGEGSNELMFPKLEILTIEQCAKLRIKQCLPKALSVLMIIDCDNLLSSWGESSSSPTNCLHVTYSKVPLTQWRLLHHLPALSMLTIKDCSDLTISPEIIKCLSSVVILCLDQAELPRWLVELTSLRKLSLYECRSLTSLPQWLGELTSLEYLEIWDCKGIRSLPDSIQQMTQLENLYVDGCPLLGRWCKSKENKMKLAHIRNRNILRSANEHEEDIEDAFLVTTNSLVTASESRIDNKGKEPMIIEDTPDVPTNMKDAGHGLAASVHGTVKSVIDNEVHPDLLYSAVMKMPGFAEQALRVALSHLVDNKAQASAYMVMDEEDRVSWLTNFLGKHY